MKPMSIRIFVVDDHFLLRIGLVGAISDETDLEVVGEAADGQAAVELFDHLQPDITLMDGLLPDIHGVEAARRILGKHRDARIILISINDTAEDVHRAIEAGLWGYIPKSCDKAAIIHAIRSVAAGERYLPPELAKKLEERGQHPLLTVRELEVLRLIARGCANKQIAAELAVSEATVKSHIAHILDKLDVPDRTRAVTLALERGMLRQ
jgi:DNA-binding NarL/FixJ family response regulator